MISAIQSRLKELLEARPAFAGVKIYTDDRPDFVNTVAQAIGRQDLVVAIGFAAGESPGSSSQRTTRPVLNERIRIAIIQHRLHTAHSAVTLLEEAIRAIQDQPIDGAAPNSPQRFRVLSHRTYLDDEGTRSCELTVAAQLLLN